MHRSARGRARRARGGRADARRLLDPADSLFVAGDILFDYPASNLVTARLREAIGALAGAAVRALSRYLALRAAAEPALRPVADSARARLGRLVDR